MELESSTPSQPVTDVTILDGAVVVTFLKSLDAKTFDAYAVKVFLPYIESQLQHDSWVDIVWDQYFENSLKSQARSKHGKVLGGESMELQTYQEIGKNFCVLVQTRLSCSP